MNPLTQILRTAKRLFRRSGFESASGNSRWTSPNMLPMPGIQASNDSNRSAARANYRVANGSTGEAIASIWSINLIGSGPSARSQHPDKTTRKALQSAFKRFYSKADIDGDDLGGLLIRAIRSLVASGEILMMLTITERGELRIRLLSPEQLDRSRNYDTASGGRIDFGVERDAAGEIVGYWLFTEQAQSFAATLRPSMRVEAQQVLHVFDAKWPGQARGISWLAPVLPLLQQFDRLLDSLGERMATAALFSGFLSDPDNSFQETGTRDGNSLSEGMAPGVLRNIGSATITFPQVPGIEGAPELLRQVLRQIAAGVGVTYEMLAADLSNTNYSSAKSGASQFYRRCRALRASLVVSRLLEPLWQRVITLEVLSGRLTADDFERATDDYFAVNFVFDGWESLDPRKDAQATALLLGCGVVSRQQVIEELGRDFEDTDAEIQADTFIQPQGASSATLTTVSENDNASP